MPRVGNGGRAAAAVDGGPSPVAPRAPAGDPSGALDDITVDSGAPDDGDGDAHAVQLHQLQQQQLQQLLSHAAHQQAWHFSGMGGAPAPPPQPPVDLAPVLAALAAITARLAPLEAAVASASSAPASPPAGGGGRVSSGAAERAPRARTASPARSVAGSDSVSRASTDDSHDSLAALLGVASADLTYDLRQNGLSPAWAIAVKSPGSKFSGDDIVNLSTLLIVGRVLHHLAWLVYKMSDDPSAVSRSEIEEILPHLPVARDALTTRLNHYQLLASGLDAQSAAALAEAAAFKRRVAHDGEGVLAGLPIACNHLAEIFADFQKKKMEHAVKACHGPPAKAGKLAASSDEDDIDSLRAQLSQSEAQVKKLSDKLSDATRKAQGPRDSKDMVARSRTLKKTDKPKPVSSAPPPESAEADSSP